MKGDYVWLRYLNHPLYYVEYPSIFGVYSKEMRYSHFLGDNNPMGISNFYLYYEKNFNVVSCFRITVTRNANTQQTSSSNNETVEKIIVSGITANYYRSFERPEYPDLTGFASSPVIRSKTQVSNRRVTFWYENLFWTIGMYWVYENVEPEEVQTYFSHVISTFKIIETEPPGLPSTIDLNVQVKFHLNLLSFEITNNEDFNLREVQVYVNSVGDNLSTGYHTQIFGGLDQGETRTIDGLELMDSKGNHFKYMNIALKNLLVTAEYPGYVKRVFVKKYIWDGISLK
jgi:hypothetical protein